MTNWHETPEALQLLAELDAAERSSDAYAGRGWHGVAEAFSSQAADCEMELEQLRDDACQALCTAHKVGTDEWFDAMDEADEALVSVKAAIKQARRDCAGDALFERADAA